jgi:DNA-binding transcriptional MerR regulator
LDKAPDAFRTISEVAEDLDVPQHVLRFWESRFRDIKPMKRGGGRRYYRPEDIQLLRGIRHLLYGEGYTIRGVQRILKEQGVRFVQSAWQIEAIDGAAPRIEDDPDLGQDENGTGVGTAADHELARGRSLLALLPTLLGDSDDDGVPVVEPRSEPLPARNVALPTAASLAREDLRKLRSVLDELGECRRLLEVAMAATA